MITEILFDCFENAINVTAFNIDVNIMVKS